MTLLRVMARSPTPYAGINRIRFEGLPHVALSARDALPCRTPP